MSEVYVELVDDEIYRIFRNQKDAIQSLAWDEGRVELLPLEDAVFAIRSAVCETADGECQNCGEYIGWAGHLHEQHHRGKGGEISRENSIWLCYECHLGVKGEHSDRRPRFGEDVRERG